jgi:hypothetical protein
MVRKGLGQSMSESNVRLDPLEFGKERSIDVDPAAYDCAALTRIPTIGLRRTARLTLSERLLRGNLQHSSTARTVAGVRR